MAGESIRVLSAYKSIQASASVADGSFSGGSATALSGTDMTSTEQDFPILDFKLKAGAETPTADGMVHVYRRNSDGTDQSLAPSLNYEKDYVASFQLAAVASKSYYFYGSENADKEAEYYLKNDNGTTLTLELFVRSRGFNVAA